jgi:DNA-binding NarL/FixJ family response regulator
MAEGHSNAAIATRIAVSEKSVSNLINSLFAKLGLSPSADHHRRVLAVLTYLDHT